MAAPLAAYRCHDAAMAVIGLVVQVLGILVAMAALLFELFDRSDRHLGVTTEGSGMVPRENPWAREASARLRIAGASEQKRFGEHSVAGRMDPQSAYLAVWVEETLYQYLDWAAEDWERQRTVEEDLRRADLRALDLHATDLRHRTRRTRQRVVIEMFGLLVVLVGTMLGSAAL